MHKPFKIKYASELAGAFVILGLVLVILAGFAAARSQAWFEGSFELRMKFDAKTGSLGLREGNEVVVLSTLAGRVGKIMPTPDGHMETTLIIKNRFLQFVRTDSTAKVKKKFVAAGDAYVEISIGDGDIVEDGDFISFQKDEELMETAQKLLADVQEVVLPMVEEVHSILKHVNAILSDLEAGKGVAGSLITDEKMSDDIKSVVRSSSALMQESQKTFRETTRLIRAAQRTWLFRRHVKGDSDVKSVIAPFHLSDDDLDAMKENTVDSLELGRAVNNSVEISLHACNMGYLALMEGDFTGAQMLLSEADSEIKLAGSDRGYTSLMESALMRATGRIDDALNLMRTVIADLKRSEREMQAQCRIMEVELLCDAGKVDEALSRIKDAGYYARKSESDSLNAAHVRALARINELRGDGLAAAGHFDSESLLRQNAGQYRDMALALENAGRLYEKMQNYSEASDRYFRSGRSLLYSGRSGQAREVLVSAINAAGKSGDRYIVEQAGAMLEAMK